MRFLLVLSSLFLLFGCNTAQEEQASTIQLLNFDTLKGQLIFAEQGDDFLYRQDTLTALPADTTFQFDVTEPKQVYLLMEKERLAFYLEPNTHLKVTNTDGKYSFSGDLERENEYLYSIDQNKILPTKGWDYKAPTLEEFKVGVDRYFNYKDSLLNAALGDNKETAFYKRQVLSDNTYKLFPPLDYINTTVGDDNERDSLFLANFDTDYFNFEKYEKFYNDGKVSNYYDRYGSQYLLMKKYGSEKAAKMKERGYYSLKFEETKANYPKELFQRLAISDLFSLPYLHNYNNPNSKYASPGELLAKYKSDLPEISYRELFIKDSTFAVKAKRYAVGSQMKPFTLKNADGEEVILDASKEGKPVFVDVWASWCGPCIGSFPKVNEMEKKYADQAVVYSVSLDSSFEDFLKGLENNKVPGVKKLYAEGAFESEFAKFFQIKAIPTYIATDAEGKFIDADGSEQFAEYLDALN